MNFINLDSTGYMVVISIMIICLMVVWYSLTYHDISNADDDDDDIDLDPNNDDD
jgi:hypothetical protein